MKLANNSPPSPKRIEAFQRPIEQRIVAVAFQDAARAAVGENVADLADGHDVTIGVGSKVQNGLVRWRNGIVAPIVGPDIVGG